MQRVMYAKIVGGGTTAPLAIWNNAVSEEIEKQRRETALREKGDRVMLAAIRGNRDRLRGPVMEAARSKRRGWLRRMADSAVIGWCILFAWALEGKLVEDDAYAG